VNSPPPKPEVILTNFFAEPTVLLVPITSRDKTKIKVIPNCLPLNKQIQNQPSSNILKLLVYSLNILLAITRKLEEVSKCCNLTD
jgi:hypothetical protein